MADYWIDSALGSGDNNGTSPVNAVRGNSAIKTGFEVDHDAGTDIWVRRTSVYDEAIAVENADIAPTADGVISSPVRFIGWPRAAIPNTTITESDWTNGSNLIDNIVGITITWLGHVNRYCTAPNGYKYYITGILVEFTVDGMGAGDEFAVGEILTNTTQTKQGKVWAFTDNLDETGTIQAVVDSSSAWVNNDNITSDGGGDAELSANATAVGFLIDREYAGSTVTGVDGKFQIEEDELYDDRPQAGIDAGWDADSHDLSIIDFNDEIYQLYVYQDNYLQFYGFCFRDSGDGGVVNASSAVNVTFTGNLFKQTLQNKECLRLYYGYPFILNRNLIEGCNSGTAQRGILTQYTYGKVKDLVINNCGYNGIHGGYWRGVDLENVNIGIEMANGNNDISATLGHIKGVDVHLGGANGYVVVYNSAAVGIENYQKILGNHKLFLPAGKSNNIAVTDTNANKKLSDVVLQIFPNVNSVPIFDGWKQQYFVGDFDLNAGARTLKFWLYNDLGQTINDTHAKENTYLKISFVDSYDDTTEYTITKAFSTQIDILDAADADDWDFLSGAFTLATASRVKAELIVSIYDAADYFLIDPQPVIT